MVIFKQCADCAGGSDDVVKCKVICIIRRSVDSDIAS